MTRPLVGFCGLAGSGKDTAALALKPYGFRKIAMADPLRESAYKIDPYVFAMGEFTRLSKLVDAIGWDAAKSNEDVRRFLQRLGTEGGRECHGRDCWVVLAQASILSALAAGEQIFVTDIRFPNEVDLIQSIGGILICVTRPGVVAINEHSSEKLGTEFADCVVHNDTTIEDLHADVVRLCMRHGVL